MAVDRALEGAEGLQELDGFAVLGVDAHLAILAHHHDRVGGGRHQHALQVRHVRGDGERRPHGDLGFAAEAFPLGEAQGRQAIATAFLLAAEQQPASGALHAPSFDAGQAWLADRYWGPRHHLRFQATLTLHREIGLVGDLDLAHRTIRQAQDNQAVTRVAADRSDRRELRLRRPCGDQGSVFGTEEADPSVGLDRERHFAVFIFSEGHRRSGQRHRRQRRHLGADEQRKDLQDQEQQHTDDRQDHADPADPDDPTHPEVGQQRQARHLEARLGRGACCLLVSCVHSVSGMCRGSVK